MNDTSFGQKSKPVIDTAFNNLSFGEFVQKVWSQYHIKIYYPHKAVEVSEFQNENKTDLYKFLKKHISRDFYISSDPDGNIYISKDRPLNLKLAGIFFILRNSS